MSSYPEGKSGLGLNNQHHLFTMICRLPHGASVMMILVFCLVSLWSPAQGQQRENPVKSALMSGRCVDAEGWRKLTESRSFESDLLDALEDVADIQDPSAGLRMSLLLLQEEKILSDSWTNDYVSCVSLVVKLRVILAEDKAAKSLPLAQVHEFSGGLAATLDRVLARKWIDARMKIEIPAAFARQFMNSPQDKILVRLQAMRYMLPEKTTRCLIVLRCALKGMVEKHGFNVVFSENEKMPEAALRTLKNDLSFKDRDSLWDSLSLDCSNKVKVYPSIPN